MTAFVCPSVQFLLNQMRDFHALSVSAQGDVCVCVCVVVSDVSLSK